MDCTLLVQEHFCCMQNRTSKKKYFHHGMLQLAHLQCNFREEGNVTRLKTSCIIKASKYFITWNLWEEYPYHLPFEHLIEAAVGMAASVWSSLLEAPCSRERRLILALAHIFITPGRDLPLAQVAQDAQGIQATLLHPFPQHLWQWHYEL